MATRPGLAPMNIRQPGPEAGALDLEPIEIDFAEPEEREERDEKGNLLSIEHFLFDVVHRFGNESIKDVAGNVRHILVIFSDSAISVNKRDYFVDIDI